MENSKNSGKRKRTLITRKAAIKVGTSTGNNAKSTSYTAPTDKTNSDQKMERLKQMYQESKTK